MALADDEAEVEIPAGHFFMGRAASDMFASGEEQPLRVVRLGSFAIDVYPVTNRRFRAFVDAGGYAQPEWWGQEGWRWLQQERVQGPVSLDRADLAGDDQPACGLSWHEANAFCAFVSRRLPTSAEWERAARGLDARPFPWGDALPHTGLCNFDNVLERTSPIGAYPAGVSPTGIHDAAGNVNNWVQDVYWPRFGSWAVREGYLSDPVLGDALANQLSVNTARRVDRGGGFMTSFSRFEVLSTTFPLGWDAGSREVWHGLRTARSL